jgi:hypothetical protein
VRALALRAAPDGWTSFKYMSVMNFEKEQVDDQIIKHLPGKGVQEVNEVIQKVTKGHSEFHLFQGLHVR